MVVTVKAREGAMFQRRHYEFVAATIRELYDDEGQMRFVTADDVVDALAAVFAGDNPSFDPKRFVEACRGDA